MKFHLPTMALLLSTRSETQLSHGIEYSSNLFFIALKTVTAFLQ